MIILTIRTDKPEAELGLFNDDNQLAYEMWEAHHELSSTIHKKIDALLSKAKKNWDEIEGIVCFKGPGSFTGLRIGLTVGNTIVMTLGASIVSTSDKDWIKTGIKRLAVGENERVSLPEYGRGAHITPQKR